MGGCALPEETLSSDYKYNMVYFSSPILNSYLELLRRKENSQLIGEYNAGHTTVQLFKLSVFFYLNMRISEARFVITLWKGVEDFSVSLLGGVLVVVSFVLAWQMDLLALYQRGGDLSGSVKLPKCSLISTAPYMRLGLQDGTQLFQ